MDENHPPVLSYAQCVASNGISKTTIVAVVKAYVEGGIDSVLARKRSINSDNARYKVDGRAQARLLEVACSPALVGHSCWTICLLENEMKIIQDEPIKYTYNLYGNLLERRAKKPDFETTELCESYEYTQEGLLKSAIFQGMRYTYTYDAMNRLKEKAQAAESCIHLQEKMLEILLVEIMNK